jgi:S-formylglutathione hydrolase FrmB
MSTWPSELTGRLDHDIIDSTALRDNPLGDPHERPVLVYLPPGYDDEPDRRYPTVYVLQGYSGQLAMWLNRVPFRKTYPELIDELFTDGTTPAAIVVFVDAWTRYGGSQFLDSPGIGNYHTYLCTEVVPWVDARYRTLADRDHRAVTGKSSGGYGAMITAMLRPDLFGALATHAGDALFEVGYRSELARRARLLRDQHAGSYEKFFDDLAGRVVGTKDGDYDHLELYCYAAAYSTDPDQTVRIPFDDTGALVPDVWRRWLANDPVVMAGQPLYAKALRSMRSIWIDAGNHDEYYLDLGAAAFHRATAAAGVPADRVHFELFDAGHGAIEYRYPLAVRWLCERMKQPVAPAQ